MGIAQPALLDPGLEWFGLDENHPCWSSAGALSPWGSTELWGIILRRFPTLPCRNVASLCLCASLDLLPYSNSYFKAPQPPERHMRNF